MKDMLKHLNIFKTFSCFKYLNSFYNFKLINLLILYYSLICWHSLFIVEEAHCRQSIPFFQVPIKTDNNSFSDQKGFLFLTAKETKPAWTLKIIWIRQISDHVCNISSIIAIRIYHRLVFNKLEHSNHTIKKHINKKNKARN